MRRRIKPIVAVVFFGLLALLFFIGKTHSDNLRQEQLALAKASVTAVSGTSASSTTATSETDENFVLNPIIDVSGWQLPSEIDYDDLIAKYFRRYRPCLWRVTNQQR